MQDMGLDKEYGLNGEIGNYLSYIFLLLFSSQEEIGDFFSFELSEIQSVDSKVVDFADYLVNNYISEKSLFFPLIWTEKKRQLLRNEVNQVHPEVQAPYTSSYNNMFSEWENYFTQPNAMFSCENELESYIHSTDTFQTNENILFWWKTRNNILPTMAKLAIRILVIPATIAANERAFSAAGRVIEERRSCLKVETIDALLFLQDYQKEK
ncbi:hypothetical protein QTP88_011470 [Uroleucon formosanum]